MGAFSSSYALDVTSFGAAPHSVLCVSTHRFHAIVSELFSSCRVVHAHDVHLASRKAKLGVYDLYCMVPTERDSSSAFLFWEQLRQFDSNTPFLFLTERGLHERHVRGLRSGFDEIGDMSQGIAHVQKVLAELMQHCATRSLVAREATEATLLAEWQERVSDARSFHLSAQCYARVQEAVFRAHASTSFFAAGGSRAWFERLWPSLFEERLQRSYTAADFSEAGDAREEAAPLPRERAST